VKCEVDEASARLAPRRWIRVRTRRFSRLELPLIATPVGLSLVAAQPPPTKDQQLQWKEYAYPNDGFAIALPRRADPHEDSTLPKATFKAFTVKSPQAYTLGLSPDRRIALHVVTFQTDVRTSLSNIGACPKGQRRDVRCRCGVYSRRSFYIERSNCRRYATGETERKLQSQSRYYDRIQCVGKKRYTFRATWSQGSTLRANIDETLTAAIITEQGGKENHCE